MNPVKLVIGFVPFLLFTVLANWIPVGWAALVGLLAALALIVVTARGGLKILPVVQALILLVIAVLGFVGGPAVDAFLTQYGRGLTSLLLGLFTRPAAVPIVIFLAVSNVERWRVGGFFWNKLGLEFTLMWSVAALFFLINGGGVYSLDHLLVGRAF